MRCYECLACQSYWSGIEEVTYCAIGVSEDEAYHEETGDWYCRYNKKTIEKILKRDQEVE